MLNFFHSKSIHRFFKIYLLIAVLLPLLVLGLVGLTVSSSLLKYEILSADHRQVHLAEYAIEQHLQRPLEDLQVISSLVHNISDSQISRIQRIIEKTQVVHKYFSAIQVVNIDGKVIAISPLNKDVMGIDVSGHKYFNKIKSLNTPYWGASFISEQLDLPLASLSIKTDYGYVITGFLKLDDISEIGKGGGREETSAKDLESRLLFITDQNGVFIAHPDKHKVMIRDYDQQYVKSVKQWNNDILVGELKYKGRDYIVNTVIMPETKWKISLYTPLENITAPITKMAVILLFLTLAVTLIAISVGAKLSSKISGSFSELLNSVNSISKGKYEVPIFESNYREFNQLSDSFEQVTKEVKAREKDLKEAESYISNIINSMPSILVSVNSDLIITQWNMTAEDETGVKADAAKGKILVDLLPSLQPEINRIKNSIESGEVKYSRKKPLYYDNKVNYEDITIFPLIANGVQGAVIRIDDVTDKVRLEDMLVQNEKMLSIGGLAAGMAHEINNPLAGMMQTADVIHNRLVNKIDLPANKKAAEEAGVTIEGVSKFICSRDIPRMIETIKESGKRAAAIVNNMLTFARKADHSKSTVSVERLLDDTLDLAITDYNLKNEYDFKQIKIIKEFKAGLPLLVCEETKIQQVILNLLLNSAQAMQGANTLTPEISIRTSLSNDNTMINIELEDNGPGMDKETSKRIFEPFFTTKDVGQGTGLGLSVSYFIITENHGGEMSAISKIGAGTKFLISLPVEGAKNEY